jgi:hypothetical protein
MVVWWYGGMVVWWYGVMVMVVWCDGDGDGDGDGGPAYTTSGTSALQYCQHTIIFYSQDML